VETYVEHLDVVEDLVVEREVVAGNDVGTGILLELPVSSTESLSGLDQRLLRDLSRPVSFSGLLELTVGCRKGIESVTSSSNDPTTLHSCKLTSHAGKPED